MFRIGHARHNASFGQRSRVLDEFAQTFGFWTGNVQEVTQETSGLALGFQEPVGKFGITVGVVSGPGHSIQTDAVSN